MTEQDYSTIWESTHISPWNDKGNQSDRRVRSLLFRLEKCNIFDRHHIFFRSMDQRIRQTHKRNFWNYRIYNFYRSGRRKVGQFEGTSREKVASKNNQIYCFAKSIGLPSQLWSGRVPSERYFTGIGGISPHGRLALNQFPKGTGNASSDTSSVFKCWHGWDFSLCICFMQKHAKPWPQQRSSGWYSPWLSFGAILCTFVRHLFRTSAIVFPSRRKLGLLWKYLNPCCFLLVALFAIWKAGNLNRSETAWKRWDLVRHGSILAYKAWI